MTKLADDLEALGSRPVEAHHIAQWVEANYAAILSALREGERLRGALEFVLENMTRPHPLGKADVLVIEPWMPVYEEILLRIRAALSSTKETT